MAPSMHQLSRNYFAKIERFMNAAQQFVGNHTKCDHQDDVKMPKWTERWANNAGAVAPTY
jgi:hypothetical protein